MAYSPLGKKTEPETKPERELEPVKCERETVWAQRWKECSSGLSWRLVDVYVQQ